MLNWRRIDTLDCMREAVVGAVVGGLIGASLAVVISWKMTEARYMKIERRVQSLEEDVDLKYVRLSGAIDRVEMSVADYETVKERVSYIEKASVRTVTTERPRPAAAPRANWWCYFRRECYRSRDRCIADDPNRAAECRQAQSAWCGGIEGKECFATQVDCDSIEMGETARAMVGTLGERNQPTRRCVEVD